MTGVSVAGERLINGMFLPSQEQLFLIRYWNSRRGWGFTEDDFVGLGNFPDWPQRGKLSAVVLDVQLGSVFRTVTEAYEVLKQVFPGRVAKSDFPFTKTHLRLHPGCKHKKGLKWRIVDLGANHEVSVASPYNPGRRTIEEPALLPHSALLWAAVLHPQWVQSMDGNKILWVNVPGYEIAITKGEDWDHVPGIWASGENGKNVVDLTANWAPDRSASWGIPVFLDV